MMENYRCPDHSENCQDLGYIKAKMDRIPEIEIKLDKVIKANERLYAYTAAIATIISAVITMAGEKIVLLIQKGGH